MRRFFGLRRHFSTVLTKDRYPEVKRGPYASLKDSHLAEFEKVLGKEGVLTTDLLGYNQDWLKMVCGYSQVVLRPKTVTQVSDILKICDRERLAVCPQGGNTGLVGGSVPVFDEVIISTSLMNKIVNVDPVAGNVTCEAGCVLEVLDNKLDEHGLMMPLDLGAKGSCQIGGNISTCAGGLRLIRYGSIQANVLGLQAVLADGTIVDCMNTLRKDNTGYHLRQLFVGSEGTLGIVTGCVMQTPPRPQAVSLAFLGVKTFEDVIKTFALTRQMLSEVLSSCEMLDRTCMEVVTQELGLPCPIEAETGFYMLVETQGSVQGHDQEKMEAFLGKAMELGYVEDGTVATTPSHILNIWQIRERITEALVKNHYLFKYDFSLPHAKYYDCVAVMKDLIKGTNYKTVTGFGHIGDGNIHLNVQADAFDPQIHHRIEPRIFEWVHAQGGSISAEHGIGFKKAKYLGYGKSPQAIGLMRNIKASMDPKGILNPYKVLP